MKVLLKPGSLHGTITAPASKSAMQRACALALLQDGQTVIHNPGISDDDQAALGIIQALGAEIIKENESLRIISSAATFSDESPVQINCGESGLSIRMFAPIAAIRKAPVNITGSGSLTKRPMSFFDEIFPALGVTVRSNNGFLPISICGPLQPVEIEIDGSLSSQFLTGMLLAYAASAKDPVCLHVKNLRSKPYIDLTLQMMEKFGYKVTNELYETFIIEPKGYRPKFFEYSVEGDWSGASFLLVAGAITGSVKVKGLDLSSTQADRAILQVLMMTNVSVSITPEEIEVIAKPLSPFQFDATDCPDLFPPLVALAAYCDGTSVIQGVSRLAHKESNRALTLQEEFGKLNVDIKLQDDLMIIHGNSNLKGAVVSSRHDHRIAMALGVAALKATGETTITEAEAINKSYPAFYEHIKSLGAFLTEFN